jgi:hypothetical protein
MSTSVDLALVLFCAGIAGCAEGADSDLAVVDEASIVPQPTVTVFSEDFENASGWTQQDVSGHAWKIAGPEWYVWPHTGTKCATDSPGTNYTDNSNTAIVSPAINAAGYLGLSLSFWYELSLEYSYDFLYIEASADGGATWNIIGQGTGFTNTWTEATIDISSYAVPQLKLRFRLVSDSSVNYGGVNIDDIILSGIVPSRV